MNANGIESADDTEAGMTLVELLVALALLALLSALLAAAITHARHARTATDRAAANATIAATQSFLRNLIAEARPAVVDATGKPHGGLTGDARTLVFRSSFVPAGQLGGIYVARLSVMPSKADPTTYDLVLVLSLDRAETSNATTHTLVTGASDVRFAYQSNGARAATEGWLSAWEDRRRLPALVSIEVGFPPRDPRHWPRFIAAPALGE